ncbi:Phosphoglycolate phosphatase [uncultured archaeon]|nr:Phosphoglycolate phosphatase [uncultured archaeon]
MMRMMKQKTEIGAGREGRPPSFEPLAEDRITPAAKSGIRHVIFDFGGVFVTEGLSKARRVYGKEIGVDIPEVWKTDLKPHWKAWEKGEITEAEFWSRSAKLIGHGFDPKRMNELTWSLMLKNEQLVDFILKLRKKGYVTSMLTNNTKEWVEGYDAIDPFNQYFSQIVSSHEVKLVKPQPEIYRVTLQRLSAKPQECIFIDDKEKNTEAACGVGMSGVVFRSNEQVIGEVLSLLDGKSVRS